MGTQLMCHFVYIALPQLKVFSETATLVPVY